MTRAGLLRLLLWLLAVPNLVTGAWAAFSPRSFYDDFPGVFGREWVSPDGPFNEHLVRDVGGLFLALGIVTVVAAVTLSLPLVRAVAVASLVFAVIHLGYHVRHLDPFDGTDSVAIVTSLAFGPALAVVVLLLAGPGAKMPASMPPPSRSSSSTTSSSAASPRPG
jgi:hypothetical protein